MSSEVRSPFVVTVLVAASLALGCGDEKAASGPDLVYDQLMATSTEAPPAPGCRPEMIAPSIPTLRVADRAGFEYYLAASPSAATWAFDYDVLPLTHATGTRVDFLHDSESPTTPVTTVENCPRTISSTAWLDPSPRRDLVHVRVSLTSTSDADRFTDIYYLNGSRTVTVHTNAAQTATSLAGTGSWFVAFVPTWGNPRATFVRLPSPGTDVVLTNVPEGPGYVALVRTPLIEDGPTPNTLIAPAGFAELWPYAAPQWFVAPLPSSFGNATVTPVDGIELPIFWQRLGLEDPLPWTDLKPNAVVPIGAGPTQAPVPLPCNASVSLVYVGLGTITVSGGIGPSTTVMEGEHPTMTTVCDAGTTSVMGTATGLTAQPVRGLLLVIGGSQ